MKLIRTLIITIFPLLFLMPFFGCSQIIEPVDTLNNKLKEVAREIMTSAKTCALISVDSQGRSRVRAMDPFSPESDFTVWFGTNSKSRKVDQIKKNPNVTLYYLDSNESGYVMIHGIAQIVSDPEEKQKRWKVEWEAFYPDKAKDFLLIKVFPKWMEVISESHGILGDSLTWEPSKVLFDSK